MRNLKKVLSLALATVMLLGMMVMGAGAVTTTKDYADGSTVTYKEAVDVMSAIGVFDGTSGSFNPTGNVTRAQAAKIITYMLLGREVAEKLGTLNAPYKDVPASHWAAGSIAYCTNLGIVGGYGNGNFKPDGNVTGYEFAKMLLTALGYDAERAGMTGKDWSTAVSRLALTNALDLGVDSSSSSIVLSNPLTREEACQMAFNTIKAPMVEYRDESGSIIVDGTVIQLGGANANRIVNTSTNERIDSDGYLQFGERYFKDLVKIGNAYDDFDRPAHSWTFGREDIGTYSSTPAIVYTAEVSKSSMSENLKNYTFNTASNSVTVDPSVNGVRQGTLSGTKKDMTDAVANLTGNGVVVEIYAGNDRVIDDIVVINTYLMTIRRINSENVTLARIGGSGNVVDAVDKDDANYSTLSAMKAGDYVLVTPVSTNGGTDYTVSAVAVPTTQSGALTRIDKKSDNNAVTTKVTVGGTSYSVAKNQADNGGDPLVDMNGLSVGSVGTTDNTVVYLDTYGYAVAIRDVGATTNFMYAFRKYQSLTSDGMLVTMVQGVAPDGSIVTLNVGTGAPSGKIDYANSSFSRQLVSYVASSGTEASTYSSDYVLTAAGTNVTTTAIGAGDLRLNGTAYAGNVKFIYVDTDNTISVREGVRAKDNSTTAYALAQNGMITAVFVDSAPTDVDSSKIIYLNAFKGWQDQSKGQAIYEAYFEGAKQEIIVKTNSYNLGGSFYSYVLDEQTNLYSVTAYTKTGSTVSAAVNWITATEDDRLIYFNSRWLNAANAEVIDLSDNKISTVGDIHDKIYNADGKVVNSARVAVLYNDASTDNGYNTVAYVYVLKVASVDKTVTAGAEFTLTNPVAATASIANGASATITLKDGQTLKETSSGSGIYVSSSDTAKATVGYSGNNAATKTITISVPAGATAGETSTVTFTVVAADGSEQAYSITVTVTAAPASAE